MKIALCFASLLLLSSAALAQDGTIGDFTARDAVDGVFGRAGDLSGTPEQRGQRIHEQTVDQQMQRIQDNQGDAAALRAQQNYSREHSYGYQH